MSISVVTAKEFRIFTQDLKELNSLIDGVKFSDEAIEQAQYYIVDFWNILPPPLSMANTVSLENFPSKILMMLGMVGFLLRGISVGEAQNQLDYSADGVTISDKNHAQMFLQIGQSLWQEFVDLATKVKISLNIKAAFGSKGSEYRFRSYII